MPSAQPHIKSCLNCTDQKGGAWVCERLIRNRIVFIENTIGWKGCPFMPSAREVKSWIDAAPAPIGDQAKERLEHLKKMKQAGQLTGYLMEGQPDSGGYQYHVCAYPLRKRGNGTGVFLRRTDNTDEILRKVRSVFRGGVTDTLRRQIQATPGLEVLPKIASGRVSSPKPRFIHYPDIRPEDCGLDIHAMEKAWERGGMYIQVAAVAGYHDNLKMIAILQAGLGRIEKAVRAGASPKELGPALQALIPGDKLGLEFGLQLAKGLALQAGIALGVAALGTAAGWAVGNFVIPGLGGAAGAAAGGTLATGLYNFLLRTYDIVDTGSQVAAKNKELNDAAILAWKGRHHEAAKAFAKVFAAIILAVMLALLAKAVADGAKGKKKSLGKEGDEWAEQQSRRTKQPGRPGRVRPRLSFAGLRKFNASRAAEVGMLQSEVQALAKLASMGYYIAVRSCNKSRLKWLKSGFPINAKPLWLPIKSLNFGKFDGLVGFSSVLSKNRGKFKDYAKAMKEMKRVEPGKKFKPEFLGGAEYEGPYALKEGVPYDFLYKDAASNSKLLFVKVGDEYIAVDHTGRPWIPDLDVTMVQRRSTEGGYLPPGVGIMGDRPHQHGSDAPDIETDLNAFFRKNVSYPQGYDPIQHGGRGGSANYLKPIRGGPEGSEFEPIYQKPGWAPGDAEEGHHVIAADGLDGYLAEAMDMAELQRFHEANPMGPWRW